MASSSSVDVIELGSSDEDTEPIPKKKKIMSKPMVHITNELPGITIKPARRKVNPVSSIGEGVTVTKVPSRGIQVANPFANKNKLNGKPIIPSKSVIQPSRLNLATKPEVKISPFVKKIGPTTKGFGQQQISKGVPTTANIPFQSRLPPGITVKRANQTIIKHNAKKFPAKNIQVQRQKHPKISKVPEMVCVDLDDDDPPPSSAGPQWYLRPEDPKDNHDSKGNTTDQEDTDEAQTSSKKENIVTRSSNIEKQNNKEPEPSKFIEITIEDSPSKPLKSKRRRDMDELAITIEDSPIKSSTDKPAPVNASDDEKTTKDTDKHSKKKLEYSRTAETMNEIEIVVTPVEEKSATQHVEMTIPNDNADTDIVEIEESPVKFLESETTTTPKKKKPNPQPQLKLNVIKTAPVKSQPKVGESKIITSPSETGEFNPTYQSFINLCFRLDNSDDMNTIVEKKIKTFYRQVPKEYTESEAFIDLVGSKMCSMKAVPDKMYMYIKDVVDELNMQRKIAKAQPAILDVVNEDREKILYGDESEFDLKRQRQIRKLEKTLKKLHRAIQKLEEQEVDFDDEEDSVYLLTESEEGTDQDNNQPLDKRELLKRYKERLIRVHAKFCQLTNTKMPSEPQVRIDARPGQPKGAAKRLEKWINKKVPIGTPLPFPDFHDVLRCVRDANQEDKLGWNEADVMEEARDLFTRCGKKLQRRRQENEWRLAASRIQAELDPAEESEDLKKKLDQNQRVAFVKESEVLNKFADRQNQLNLEAVEIGDKEANESPVETDEEEPSEEKTSLETKEKRKQRLKRLLQEKSQKSTDEKTQSQEIKEDSVKEPEPEEKEETSKDIKNKGEIKSKERDPLTAEDKSDTEKIHSLSDESSKIDSDMDELHLLQKLHSDVVDSSTFESSDSETQIDIISSGDSKMRDSDVISIENSSYSESENNHEPEIELVSYSKKRVISEIVDTEVEIECSVAGVQKKINRSYNDERNESVENILLASSDDEDDKDKEATNDPNSVNEINVDQSSEMNADTTDASTMDSTEVTVAKNNNLNEIDITCLSSTENSDGNIPITDETISVINSVESVQFIEVEPTNNGSNNIESSESNHDGSNPVLDKADTSITDVDEAISAINSVESVKSAQSIDKIDSSESNHEESNSVKDEVDKIKAICKKDSANNSNDISRIVKSLDDFKSAGHAAIGSKDKDPSDDVRNAKSIVENKTSHNEGENEKPIIDEKESSSYKDENETPDKPDNNVKTFSNERENENSVSKDKMEVSSNNDEKEMSDITDEIVKMSSNECDNKKLMSKDDMELSSNNDEKETAKTDDSVKTSSNECENEKAISKDEMELSSNNDDKETSDKTDDNVNEFTNQRYVVDACSKGVTSVEPMEVDINMDNT